MVQLQDGKVESAATQIIHGNLRVLFEPIQAVGQRRGGWLIDDALDGETSQVADLFGGVALGVIEVSGHSDHRSAHWLPKVSLSIPLQLLEHLRRDLFRRVRVTMNR